MAISASFCKAVYTNTDQMATSGNPTNTLYAANSTVYGFATLNDDTAQYSYTAGSNWEVVSGRTYKIGTVVANKEQTITGTANIQTRTYRLSFKAYVNDALATDDISIHLFINEEDYGWVSPSTYTASYGTSYKVTETKFIKDGCMTACLTTLPISGQVVEDTEIKLDFTSTDATSFANFIPEITSSLELTTSSLASLQIICNNAHIPLSSIDVGVVIKKHSRGQTHRPNFEYYSKETLLTSWFATSWKHIYHCAYNVEQSYTTFTDINLSITDNGQFIGVADTIDLLHPAGHAYDYGQKWEMNHTYYKLGLQFKYQNNITRISSNCVQNYNDGDSELSNSWYN